MPLQAEVTRVHEDNTAAFENARPDGDEQMDASEFLMRTGIKVPDHHTLKQPENHCLPLVHTTAFYFYGGFSIT